MFVHGVLNSFPGSLFTQFPLHLLTIAAGRASFAVLLGPLLLALIRNAVSRKWADTCPMVLNAFLVRNAVRNRTEDQRPRTKGGCDKNERAPRGWPR